MAPKKNDENEALLKALEEFLDSGGPDEIDVTDLEQPLELHLSGTTAYIPSFTKAWLDETNNGPVMAILTQTDTKTNTVYFWTTQPTTKKARKLRFTDSMGGANVGFGVPLRKLGLKFPVGRRIILPVHSATLPTKGPIFWVSFAELEHEARDIDKELIAAAKQVKKEEAKARKTERLNRIKDKGAP